jgi:hypothetical protein
MVFVDTGSRVFPSAEPENIEKKTEKTPDIIVLRPQMKMSPAQLHDLGFEPIYEGELAEDEHEWKDDWNNNVVLDSDYSVLKYRRNFFVQGEIIKSAQTLLDWGLRYEGTNTQLDLQKYSTHEGNFIYWNPHSGIVVQFVKYHYLD